MAVFKEELNEFAPSLDAEPIFERPSEGRWDQAPTPDVFTPEAEPWSGAWADGFSLFDVPEAAGNAFLDPGSFAFASHVAPMLESSTLPVGAIGNASADLDSPIFGGGGGGGGDDKNKGKGTPGDLF